MIILLRCDLCTIYVVASHRPNGGHFETHIHGYQYLNGIDRTVCSLCESCYHRAGFATAESICFQDCGGKIRMGGHVTMGRKLCMFIYCHI